MHGIPNVWLARAIIIVTTILMIGSTVCLARSKWIPSTIILDLESLKKLLENAVLLLALLLAFAVTLPTAVDPDVLQAADNLQLDLNRELAATGGAPVTWLVSHWFFDHITSATNYLSTGLLGAFLVLVSLVCLDILKDDSKGLTKTLMPTLLWLSVMIVMGVVHFCYGFLLLVYILAPKSYHLRIRTNPSHGFDLFTLVASLFTFVPIYMLYHHRRHADGIKHGPNRVQAA